jgi:hypothetical protein
MIQLNTKEPFDGTTKKTKIILVSRNNLWSDVTKKVGKHMGSNVKNTVDEDVYANFLGSVWYSVYYTALKNLKRKIKKDCNIPNTVFL